ncbi:MAG TPA: exosortase Q [Caldimonas sp.]
MRPLIAPGPLWTTRSGRGLARRDALPAGAWLGAQVLALWPHWRWAAARLADGSDDPLGLAAIALLALAVWRLGPSLRAAPAPGWLRVAIGLTLAATLAQFWAPALFAALLAVLAVAALLCAFMPAGGARLPLAGLAVLALPLVSSLQFYAGYPLRVATAQLSTWALQGLGFAAAREGTAMRIEDRLVIVDAPCSGVQMVWMGYFCACAVGWWFALGDRVFAKRLAGVGAIVLAGYVLRNSLLVGLEARAVELGAAGHEAIGLGVLALVCLGVVRWLRGGRDAAR